MENTTHISISWTSTLVHSLVLFLLLIFKKWYTLSYLYRKVECDGLFKNINKNNYAIHVFLNIIFFCVIISQYIFLNHTIQLERERRISTKCLTSILVLSNSWRNWSDFLTLIAAWICITVTHLKNLPHSNQFLEI